MPPDPSLTPPAQSRAHTGRAGGFGASAAVGERSSLPERRQDCAPRIEIDVFRAGETLPAAVAAPVTQLFNEFYYRYHYIDEVHSPARFRFVARDGVDVVGFGTVEPAGAYGVLSHLLVDRRHHGRGVGRLLEEQRFALCRREDLAIYSSCVTVGLQSQRLKAFHGLGPINYKLGYRVGVFSRDDISSAVTFASEELPAAGVTETRLIEDDENRRIRLVTNDAARIASLIPAGAERSEDYVDLLLPPGLRPPAGFVFQGLDIMPKARIWGLLWQLENPRRRNGLRARPDFIMAPDEIERRALALVRHD